MADRAAPPRRGRLIACGITGIVLLGACSPGTSEISETSDTPTPEVTVTATTTVTATPEAMASQQGAALGEARKAAETAGYTVTVHDASEGDARPGSNWTVCFETVGYGTVDFGAVTEGALCPEKDGGALRWPEVPKVTGISYSKALGELDEAGLAASAVGVDSAYADVSVSAEEAGADQGGHRVCFQSPKAGADLKPETEITLSLVKGKDCPAKAGAYLDETKDPNYTPPPAPDSGSTGGSTGGGTGGTGGSTGGGTSTGGSTTGGSTGGGGWDGTCELMSPAGNCYKAGQFCANKHVGLSTHDANGRMIYCKIRDDGQRWNYS